MKQRWITALCHNATINLLPLARSTPFSHLNFQPLSSAEMERLSCPRAEVRHRLPPPLEHVVCCIVILSWLWAAVLSEVISSPDYLSQSSSFSF